ncbi:hypothetical protein CYMTET_24577 [Cymbomonas tetramitiformis]|uniref:Uncharacterized protein n=1 Tax=Cymbomonas tetramitiformis TaxID=36881 RepID=A0AAE0FVS2_9CHLO|nr:hypothetical protein CYMTET_50816 [Cymbomonas tetramitiformis]KAK3266829.1 hypothetical protein CYMTET_24577 [Cymbomonas tetramitiformis]
MLIWNGTTVCSCVSQMERFLYTWLLFLCVFKNTAVANQQEFVSQNFGYADPYPDSPQSNIIAAKNGFQVFTNVPELGLTETLAVTHANGLYVAGEKVATVNEVSTVQQAITNELQAMRRQLQVLVDREQHERENASATVGMLRHIPNRVFKERHGGGQMDLNGHTLVGMVPAITVRSLVPVVDIGGRHNLG